MKPHLFAEDLDVPADHRGRRFCRCGVAEDHRCHDLPDVPEQAEVRGRYEHEERDE